MTILKWQTVAVAVLGSVTTVGIVAGAAHWPAHSVRVISPVAIRSTHPASSEYWMATVPAKSDPKAIELRLQMAEAYGKLTSYSDVEIGEGGATWGVPKRIAINYRRPGQFAMEVTREDHPMRVVADSQYLYRIPISAGRAYTRQPRLPATKNCPANLAVPMAAIGQGMPIMIAQLLESNAEQVKLISKLTNNVVCLGDSEIIDGVVCDTLQAFSTSGNQQSFGSESIGHDDHLLRRLREHVPAMGQTPSSDYTITLTNVRANTAIPDSVFRFDPPPGSKSVDLGMHNDPKAQAVIQAMYDAYDALHSFSCTEDIKLTPGKYYGTPIKGPWPMNDITYVVRKPFAVSFNIQDTNAPDTGLLTVVSDGNTAYVHGSGRKWNAALYVKQDLGDVGGVGNMRATLTNFVRDAVTGTSWMPAVLMGWHIMPADGGYDFTLEEPTTIDSEQVDRIFVPLRNSDPENPAKSGLGERLYISRSDHLFRRIEEISDDPLGGVNITAHTFTNIRINPDIPDSTFQFTPVAGSKSVASFESLRQR